MRITLNDVARQAGVSKTTAAYILNGASHLKVTDATRRRVQDAARTLGYRRSAVAAGLRSGRADAFGVFAYSPLHSMERGRLMLYYKDVLVLLAVAAARVGLRIMPILIDSERAFTGEELQTLADQRMDGLIVAYPPRPETYDLLAQVGLHYVEFGSGQGPHVISVDDFGGAVQATEYLLSLGHRRIVHLTEGDSTVTNAIRGRKAGFCATLARHGLSEESSVISSLDALRERLSLPASQRPTAVFAFVEQDAMDAMDTAHELGLSVPEDFSIVGFENGPISVLARPKLTTIHTPLDDMAQAAIALLMALCRDEEAVVPPPFPTRLIVRASTAPAPFQGEQS